MSTETHTYRLRLPDDGHGEPRDIEFSAQGADVVLHRAEQLCGHRRVVVFEDGRKLVELQRAEGYGFWIIHPCAGA